MSEINDWIEFSKSEPQKRSIDDEKESKEEREKAMEGNLKGDFSNFLESEVERPRLFINVRGCGYPPKTNCGDFIEKYQEIEESGKTFPCHPSILNPLMVLESFNRKETLKQLLMALFIPIGLSVFSLIILTLWYCPPHIFFKKRKFLMSKTM